jgi:filamentous hemagglutinin family protein
MVARPRLVVAHAFLLSLLLIASPVYAEVTTSITPTTGTGNLGTSVTQAENVYNITGGTRPGNGTNLFHSFGNFSVGAIDTARFLNTTPELATWNILGRVTGGNASNLFGTIDTLSYGGANLFLMNPAGIVFGPDATLNVGGSVTFTTANSLRLTDTGIFHADSAATNVLTSAPVAAFGFLGSNSGSITVQGSNLSVPLGQSLNFVAGDIAIGPGEVAGSPPQAARITAKQGQINLVSVASAGEVQATTFQPAPGMIGGSITLGPGTLADVGGDAGGTIKIRSGNLVMDNATISSDTMNAHGALIAVDINLTDDLTISDTRGIPAITARTSGTGNAGEIQISSDNMQITSNGSNAVPFALIDTHSSGDGKAGNVAVTTGNLSVIGSPGTWHFIDSGPQAAGAGGNITIGSQGNIEITGATISTGTQLAEILELEPSGPAGNLSFTADHMITDKAFFLTTATFGAETQQAGNLTMNVRDISMANSVVSAAGSFGGGAITISADSLITDATQLDTFTAFGLAEGITFNGRILELRNGSTWSTSTFGDSNAGNIRVVASDHVTLRGNAGIDPSGFFSNSFGEAGGLGGSGSITVTTPILTMREGRINTSTATSGRGGNVIINAGTVEISGEFPYPDTGGFFGITNIHPSGIFTQTVGSEFCAGPCGDAGNIVANVGTLDMGPGAQLNSGTNNTGRGGDITINATNRISLSGTLSNGLPVGVFSRTIGTTPDAGSGGNIALTASQSVTISDGASVSASSTGPGNAGNILINAGQQLEMRDGSITTQATQASGGNIKIQAVDRVRLVNSPISTSVRSGPGSGGNITIDPNVVVLQNSPITAQADRGAGGNITITTPLFLADSTSPVNASSQFGRNGTVTIQSPTSNLSESLGTLPSEPNQAHSLLTQRCAALVNNGQASSFVVAGREQLPADPGGWLTSPLAFTALGESLDAGHAVASTPAIMAIAAHDTGTVSLRRLTPAVFLLANFAESEATGCHS